jgi:hypothetical protein
MDASQFSLEWKNASVIETTNPVTRTLPRFERREKDAVRDDAASPIDAQRLIENRHQEDQPDPRPTNHIGKAVDAPIAWPVRDDERRRTHEMPYRSIVASSIG